ncbi:hypothetical protein BS47DRAFT_1367425 [Hydnum rufescens UP504]|uniref:Uncharacterized protein n=1 Tax=Hydnum rufescens UP504 TaxID=1448309 RepID=A0A9P6AIB2_9AGAM|nr:hypothetical protein BS47DRAFT_1367425 [Hydnum rufescens UP504]
MTTHLQQRVCGHKYFRLWSEARDENPPHNEGLHSKNKTKTNNRPPNGWPQEPHTRHSGCVVRFKPWVQVTNDETPPEPPWQHAKRSPPKQNDTKQRPERWQHEPHTCCGRTRMNHTSAMAGVWFYTRLSPYYQQQNEDPPKEPPPVEMTTPWPNKNQQHDPPKQ